MFFNNTDKRYNQFSAYLKNKFGAKVYKITIDAGFSCPNRDGKISTGGCIFCDDGGSFPKLIQTCCQYKNKLALEQKHYTIDLRLKNLCLIFKRTQIPTDL